MGENNSGLNQDQMKTQNNEKLSEVITDGQEAPEVEQPSYEELVTQLKESNAKAEENWNMHLRSKAEMDNMKKRHSRDQESAHKYAIERFSQELLQVRDSLELGIIAAQGEVIDPKKLLEGSELTLKLLSSVMEKFGIAEINPEGEKFNPEKHQAMTTQERDDVDANTVIQVVQKGYFLNERLLRAAMVIVSKQSENANTGAEKNNLVDETA